MTTAPRVTIGLPVYNGAATLEEAVRPLLAQTYRDFELLISDNASIDGTREVAERLAREDSRIRYVRQPANVGANGNYSFVARAARGEFLKWSSASDWVAPTFLERCLAALDAMPEAVLAAPRTRLFEQTLDRWTESDADIAILSDSPLERLVTMQERLQLNNAFNGLIRMSALRQTRLVEAYMSADMILMGHLALIGKFVLLHEPLFYRRMEVATSTSLQDEDARLRHHYPEVTSRTLLQLWKQQLGWFRAALSAPMAAGERLRALRYLGRRLLWARESLLQDLVGAVRYAVRRPA